MHNHDTHRFQAVAGWCLLALAIPIIIWGADPVWHNAFLPPNLRLWNSTIELFSVIVATLAFATGYQAILSARRGAVVLLGIAFLGVALLDLTSIASSIDTLIQPIGTAPPQSTFLWLAARMLAAIALLAYAWLPNKPEVSTAKKRLAVVITLVVVGLLWYFGSRAPRELVHLFDGGLNATPTRIVLDWLIVTLNVATLLALWRRRKELVHECVMALGFAVTLAGVSQLSFMSSGGVEQTSAQTFGHLCKLAAYLYLLHATANEAIRRPLQRITAQHRREELALSVAPDGVLWVDASGQILMANPAMQTLTGYSITDLVGRNVDILLPEHVRPQHAESIRAYFRTPHPRAMGALNLTLVRRDGTSLPIDISLGHFEDEGTLHAIAYVRDLSERKNFEESLRHKATHDELTGLPNRWLFRMQLNQALARASRSGLHVAVMFIDLDHFKSVNDTFGHATGDALLVQVSERFRAVLRENDTLARLGGDEFAILLADITMPNGVVNVASKLLASLQAPYRLHEQDVYSGGSVGIAYYPEDAKDSETMLRFADMAMYEAKQAGRGSYAFYSKEMDQRAHGDVQMHSRLKEAMSQSLLRLHYQPQVDVTSGLVVGVEALLRWTDPVFGEVSPAQFVPVAEATGLILPLSEWVLEAACVQIAAWTRASTPVRVAVNFSMHQFGLPDLAERVRATLGRTGAQAQWLDIEITESVAMKHPEQSREQIKALVALGCTVALDDFGTGFSSLAYLKALPVSKLKLDRRFIQGVPFDASDVTISRAIIALAHNLGLSLVAEGVETDAQLAFLREYGCEVYQGWLFCKAISGDDMSSLLRTCALIRAP